MGAWVQTSVLIQIVCSGPRPGGRQTLERLERHLPVCMVLWEAIISNCSMSVLLLARLQAKKRKSIA